MARKAATKPRANAAKPATKRRAKKRTVTAKQKPVAAKALGASAPKMPDFGDMAKMGAAATRMSTLLNNDNLLAISHILASLDSATQALAEPEEVRASPSQTKQDRRRIKELERELRRKERALAETAALLVLSKKLEAIFHKGEDE